jgi:SynChlorMet cassette radical SAM/SPASM protein ScmF
MQLNQLYFYLTEGCNLKCRHCWLAPKYDPTATRYNVLPVTLFEKAILEGKSLGLRGVKLTGGEPLIHPDIVRILEIIRREELNLSIETNGFVCTPSLAAEIAKSVHACVSVSLDSPHAETHDSIRGVPGSFAKALSAVCNLKAAGIAPQIIMTLMPANRSDVESMIHLAEEAGAESVKFNVIQPVGRGLDQNGLSIQELIELGRQVETDLARRTRLRLVFDLPPAFKPLSRLVDPDVCGILGILGVFPGGEYALCGIGSHIPELVFGSIENDCMTDVWRNNHFLRNLRKGLPEKLEGICKRCLMLHRCLGACIAQNYHRTGRAWAPYWFCSEADEAGIFPQSRLKDVALESNFCKCVI